MEAKMCVIKKSGNWPIKLILCICFFFILLIEPQGGFSEAKRYYKVKIINTESGSTAKGVFLKDSYPVLATDWWCQGFLYQTDKQSVWGYPTLLIADDTGTFFWVNTSEVEIAEVGEGEIGFRKFYVFPQEVENDRGIVLSSLGPSQRGIFLRGENLVHKLVVRERYSGMTKGQQLLRPYFIVEDDEHKLLLLYVDEVKFVRVYY